ncbi:MAG: hypothetical protein J6X94_10650 [Lachnospiraceae bacterium]|nr:hypothetical protein [Lachnospiraceae bacterium]
MEKMKYVCEVCGKTEIMTPEEAYQAGWDYPPFMGSYGVVSARTCPRCPMMKTAWAALVLEKKQYEELTDIQKETIMRIKGEPRNMQVDD